jgi:hypothetical protein
MAQNNPFYSRKTMFGHFIRLIVLPLLLTACFSGPKEKNNAAEKSATEKETVMDTFRLSQLTVPYNAAYNNILDDFSKDDLQNIDRALTIFSNNRADSLSRDSMLITFNEYLTSVMHEYYDKRLIGNRELGDHFRNKEDQSEAQKMISALASHGINLNYRDGDFYLEPDISFIYSHLSSVLTASSRDYLQTKISISKGFIPESNQSLSPPDSLAHQIVVWEDFMVRNPEYLLKDEIQALYIDVLSAYLSGNEQMPMFDSNTKILDPKFHSSYLKYIEEYPNRESTKIVRRYYDLLASKGFKYSEELDAFLSEVNFNPSQKPQ